MIELLHSARQDPTTASSERWVRVVGGRGFGRRGVGGWVEAEGFAREAQRRDGNELKVQRRRRHGQQQHTTSPAREVRSPSISQLVFVAGTRACDDGRGLGRRWVRRRGSRRERKGAPGQQRAGSEGKREEGLGEKGNKKKQRKRFQNDDGERALGGAAGV